MTSMTSQAANDNHHDTEMKLREAFRRSVDERVGAGADFAAREAAGLELANNLCREDQLADLRLRSTMFIGDELSIEGKLYRRHSKKMPHGRYHGLCGTLMVPRALYREAGIRNGPTVVPLELDAGLVE